MVRKLDFVEELVSANWTEELLVRVAEELPVLIDLVEEELIVSIDPVEE